MMTGMNMPAAQPRLIVFDVFGTVVDWHGSIVKEVSERFPSVDANGLALAWRAGYQPAMQGVRSGARGWVRLDVLHREILDGLLPRFGLGGLSEAERADLNRVWHRLDPWPDSVAGLTRLRSRFTIAPLSNGNLALLTAMAKRAGLPWDCVLSTEVFQAYKPDPRTYLGAVEAFGLQPGEVLMAAAHQDDLDAARSHGLMTAYVERPWEFGRQRPKDVTPSPDNQWHARDIGHLADQLLGT